MRLFYLLLSLLLLASPYSNLKADTSIPSVPIGVILPLSGPYAHFGEAARFGIDLALKKVENNSLNIIYEDCAFDANKALTAAIKLIESDKVKYLIVLGTPTSSAVLPYSSKKISQPLSGPPQVNSQRNIKT